jgi:hypothetical protein
MKVDVKEIFELLEKVQNQQGDIKLFIVIGLIIVIGILITYLKYATKSIAEEAYKSGSGAEVGRALINAGIPVNQAISALKSYSGITPEIVNQAYIGGESLGTAPPPTLNTQYNYSDPATYYRPPSENNLILTRPIVDAAFTPPVPTPDPAAEAAEAAGPFVGSGDQGARAGGLMSIDRKKRVKTKPKKVLLAA